MMVLLVAFVGALLVFLGTALGCPTGERTPWTAAAGLAAVCVAACLYGAPETPGQIHAAATIQGEPAVASVVLQRGTSPRQVRQLRLERPVPMGAPVLIALGALGVLAIGWRRRKAAPAVLAVGAAVAAGIFLAAGGAGEGPAGLDAFLSDYDRTYMVSMTPPAGRWTFDATGIWALAGVCCLGLVALGVQYLPEKRRAGAVVASVGVLATVLAAVLQVAQLEGLFWTGAQSAVWASAVGLAVVGQERMGHTGAWVSALALALIGLAAG